MIKLIRCQCRREGQMDIQLNFINNSNDVNNSEIVIFQKNVATDFDELAVAWQG